MCVASFFFPLFPLVTCSSLPTYTGASPFITYLPRSWDTYCTGISNCLWLYVCLISLLYPSHLSVCICLSYISFCTISSFSSLFYASFLLYKYINKKNNVSFSYAFSKTSHNLPFPPAQVVVGKVVVDGQRGTPQPQSTSFPTPSPIPHHYVLCSPVKREKWNNNINNYYIIILLLYNFYSFHSNSFSINWWLF